MNWQWLLLSFKGRITRKLFWMFNLIVSFLWLALMLLSGADLRHLTKEPTNIVFDIAVLWPALAVQAKRWHDLNKSAWHMLVNLIPLVGPIWAIIQTGFIPGTPGLNRYGNDPLYKVEDKSKKVFVSGESTPYFIEIMLFIVLPIGVLWLVVEALLKGDWMVLLPSLPVFIFLVFYFNFLRNKRVFKITTDDKGIAFYGLLKEIDSPWADVLSITANRESFQDMIEVRTNNGNFRFPLFMKSEAEQYPKLKNRMRGWIWVFADGTEEEIAVENNPLYLDINSRLKEQQNMKKT